jgi:hypothetical protein
MNLIIFAGVLASLAQPVEQLIRNEQVVGSSPIGGSIYNPVIFSDPDKHSFVRIPLEAQFIILLYSQILTNTVSSGSHWRLS